MSKVRIAFVDDHPTLLAGMAAGLALALLFAFLTVQLRVDQVLVGLAITIFAAGLTGYLFRDLFGGAANKVPPHNDRFREWRTAEQNQPRASVAVDDNLVTTSAEVVKSVEHKPHARHGCITRHEHRSVLELAMQFEA